MSLWFPFCSCTDRLDARVTMTFHARQRSEEMIEVRCAECSKVLKPVGTVRISDPQTGLNTLATTLWKYRG